MTEVEIINYYKRRHRSSVYTWQNDTNYGPGDQRISAKSADQRISAESSTRINASPCVSSATRPLSVLSVRARFIILILLAWCCHPTRGACTPCPTECDCVVASMDGVTCRVTCADGDLTQIPPLDELPQAINIVEL